MSLGLCICDVSHLQSVQSWLTEHLSSQSSGECVWPLTRQIDNACVKAGVDEAHAPGLEQFINLPAASSLCSLDTGVSALKLWIYHLLCMKKTVYVCTVHNSKRSLNWDVMWLLLVQLKIIGKSWVSASLCFGVKSWDETREDKYFCFVQHRNAEKSNDKSRVNKYNK